MWICTHLKQNPSVYTPVLEGPIQEDPVHGGGLSREAMPKAESIQGALLGTLVVSLHRLNVACPQPWSSAEPEMWVNKPHASLDKLERPPYSDIGFFTPKEPSSEEPCSLSALPGHDREHKIQVYSGSA